MRLVSYNILDGGVGRADPLGEVLEAQNADVIVLVEATDEWVVARTAKRLGLNAVTGAADQGVVTVLSRWPIASHVNHAASDNVGPRAWLEVQLRPPDVAPVVVHAIHLHARATLADEQKRLTQIARVLNATRPLRETCAPHVLVGDFNSDAPRQRIDLDRCKRKMREAYAANGNVIPRDVVAALLEHGYTDTLSAVHGETAFDQATFTTHWPAQRVDYVFTHGLPREAIVDAWIETDRLATYASDHYPIGVELRLRDRA